MVHYDRVQVVRLRRDVLVDFIGSGAAFDRNFMQLVDFLPALASALRILGQVRTIVTIEYAPSCNAGRRQLRRSWRGYTGNDVNLGEYSITANRIIPTVG